MVPARHTRTGLRVRIFVCGDSPSSREALHNWRAIEAKIGDLAPECDVVDVMERPDEVLRADLVATPTTMVEGRGGFRRILGTLNDHEQVRAILRSLAGRAASK